MLFMLAMVFVVPLGFSFVVWRSFRSEGRRRARGEQIDTPGAIRWSEDDMPRRRSV
ncbi:MAG: hypothetical protein IT454_19295 [Planctomycetes bacterium]|nr:hypothetical protein [Planctomycetota bacterium]